MLLYLFASLTTLRAFGVVLSWRVMPHLQPCHDFCIHEDSFMLQLDFASLQIAQSYRVRERTRRNATRMVTC